MQNHLWGVHQEDVQVSLTGEVSTGRLCHQRCYPSLVFLLSLLKVSQETFMLISIMLNIQIIIIKIYLVFILRPTH